MLVHHYLEQSAARTPDVPALVTDECQLTFAAVDLLANGLARGLREGGVQRGDRVVVQLDNCAEAAIAVFGILKAGAAFVMVNPSTKGEKLAHIVRDSGASAVVAAGTRRDAISVHLRDIETLHSVVLTGDCDLNAGGLAASSFADLTERGGTPPETGSIDLDLACLLYTSGSTGLPKGVMLTHANIRAAIDSIAQYLCLTPADRVMNVLPLSFGYGLTQLFSAVKVGAPFYLEKGMLFPHVTLSKMAREQVTGLAIVPTIAAVLLGLDLSKYDLRSLRYITNAGAGLPVAHVRRIREVVPHVHLIPMYGQTECLRISYLSADDVDRRPDSVGRGMPNQDVAIVDETGSPVAAGETGELVVRGSHVMRGYWRMPEETARKLRPGCYPGETVLHTGDLFRQDADGFLYFVARSDDIIKSKGEKVSPREVENALFRLDGIAEAAVVGVDHPVFGQAVKAVVVLRPGVTLNARDVQRHCASCLEDFMVPSVVEFRAALPKSDNGKILKGSLKDQLAVV